VLKRDIMLSCVTRKVVDTSIYSVIPDLVGMSRIIFMLCKAAEAAEAAKAPSALPMIHFIHFIVDSLNDNGCRAS